MKYVLVVGGVLSGIGKGVSASSLGMLLKRAGGLRVSSIKIDPYLNPDAGTMSPFEHGEVFVLDDGGEVDLDLGNYERFIGVRLTRDHNITTGKIYQRVLERERRGDYLGKTVQVVPHVTDAIQEWIESVAHMPVDASGLPPDVCVIELGGTVGDIESMPFIEALRQFIFKVGPGNVCTVLVSLVPLVGGPPGEQKTKPTQHAVKELRSLGMSPDLLFCRCAQPVDDDIRRKLGFFCQVPKSNVISVHDTSNLYHVPLLLREQGALHEVMAKLCLDTSVCDGPLSESLAAWKSLAEHVDQLSVAVDIAVCGKYTGLPDAYQSVIKALQHSATAVDRKLRLVWVDSCDLEPNAREERPDNYEQAWRSIRTAQGILVPGGFGDRGAEGKILACKYAREHKVPYLGICFGMQLAVVEYARYVCGMPKASSAEFDAAAENQVVIYMPEISRTQMGGTMRLGSRRTLLTTSDCMAFALYGGMTHEERHRHRYEVNPEMVRRLSEAGMRFVGQDETGKRMEVVELSRDVHPFFFGHQAHPEFKSRPGEPSPPFFGFLLAATQQLDAWLTRRRAELASVATEPSCAAAAASRVDSH